MDTTELKEVVVDTGEAIAEEVVEAVATGKTGLKTAVKVGVIGTVSVAAWEFAIKPLLRKSKGLLTKMKASKKSKKAEVSDTSRYDMELDDIPEIDD